MSESLPTFLKHQAPRCFRNLLKQVEGLTADEAAFHRQTNWPGHRWGIGQDGSITGILYHVAAWKKITLPLLSLEGKSLPLDAFDTTQAPDREDFDAVLAWLIEIGAEWNDHLALLPEDSFDTPKEWEGNTITIAQLVVEIMEHDVQHSAQVEYLRQWHRVGAPAS